MEITGQLEKVEEQYRLYPVTICQARYTGVYEHGLWAAFLAYPEDIPDEAFSDDITCMNWWTDHREEVGVGDTPNEAYDALKRAYVRGTMKDFSVRS